MFSYKRSDMPEGPTIVILKERVAKLHLEGKQVIAVEGNSEIDEQRLLRKKLVAFRSWGKHFLICFNDFTIKIHLMMYGSYSINERTHLEPKLRIQFKEAEISFYTCIVELIEEDLDQVYDWAIDIMSDEWDEKKVLQVLKEHSKLLVCDALLAQNIFPGVGNIIKNEVLYRVRIHPLSAIASIPLAKLKAMIKETRAYGFEFFEQRKAGTLSKNWKAYQQDICKRCNLPMHRKELGKNKRLSFFCPNCQLQYKTEVQRKLL